MEIDFNDIIGGKEQNKKPVQIHEKQKKMTQTDTRARQQSCMVNEIDKDLLPAGTTDTVKNFRISLSDMLSIDKDDPSLQTYKQSLLGNIKEEQLKENQVAQVEIIKLEIVCPDRPKGNISVSFDEKSNKIKQFKIKQGCVYRLRVHFKVYFDIVFGLKFVNNIFKMLAKVEKQQQKMGSFAPQNDTHVYDLQWIQAPEGFLARGDYKGKALFLDNDGIVHCQFDYVITIDKDW